MGLTIFHRISFDIPTFSLELIRRKSAKPMKNPKLQEAPTSYDVHTRLSSSLYPTGSLVIAKSIQTKKDSNMFRNPKLPLIQSHWNLLILLGLSLHNIIHIHNSVLWDWQHFMEYSLIFPHSVWNWLEGNRQNQWRIPNYSRLQHHMKFIHDLVFIPCREFSHC